jgi:hypothetical protein
MVDNIDIGTILLDGSTVLEFAISRPSSRNLVVLSVLFRESLPYRVCVVDNDGCSQCRFRFRDIESALHFYGRMNDDYDFPQG